jgi:metallophosphoesterase superfamily enzyme
VIVHDDWLLTPARAALHLPTATLVLADLHLGYERARHRAGEAIPGRPLDDVLAPLSPLITAHRPRRLVIAGDLFEAGPDRETAAALVAWFARAGVELTAVVPGNHDGKLNGWEDVLPVRGDGIEVGGWRVVHGDGPLPEGRVVHGHTHPWARWSGLLSGACYLVGPSRLVLPAFSADAAGVNVLPGRKWGDHRCCVIAGEEVLDFGELTPLRKRMLPRG